MRKRLPFSSWDDRYNPMAWAFWFWSFVKSLTTPPSVRVPIRRHKVLVLLSRAVRVAERCRSQLLLLREWKMKCWIQALREC